MSSDSTGGTFADEGMRATGIHLSATAAGVWNANVSLQSQTNRDTNGLVIIIIISSVSSSSSSSSSMIIDKVPPL